MNKRQRVYTHKKKQKQEMYVHMYFIHSLNQCKNTFKNTTFRGISHAYICSVVVIKLVKSASVSELVARGSRGFLLFFRIARVFCRVCDFCLPIVQTKKHFTFYAAWTLETPHKERSMRAKNQNRLTCCLLPNIYT